MTLKEHAYLVRPNYDDTSLTERLQGYDHKHNRIDIPVVKERPVTLFLNHQEIITNMTVGDYPEYLAIGYLLNQHMLKEDDVIDAIDYDDDLGVVVVRTKHPTNYEAKLQKKIRTSGCAQGTMFGDVMDHFSQISLNNASRIKTSWLHRLLSIINQTDSLYLKAGALHGCVLCQEDNPLIYMEDVGRHNALDKIAGYMFRHKVVGWDKIFYTTGRLTSEMVIKTVHMKIPILVSRSGFSAWGVELARRANLTLIGRARGKRFQVLSGDERVIYDMDQVEES